jgi:LemA protein
MSIATIIILALAALVVIYCIAIYNQLVALRNRFQNGFAQIEVQLKRRYDLIPNLVETAKAYMAHERETLEAVIAARNAAASGLAAAAANPGNAAAIADLGGREGALGAALGRLNVVMEAYPDLKASANFVQLQTELSAIEDKVAASRRFYNSAVNEYNTAIEQFPASIIAGSTGFTKREMFDVGETERAQINIAPTVKF